jgi:hypothetical protein
MTDELPQLFNVLKARRGRSRQSHIKDTPQQTPLQSERRRLIMPEVQEQATVWLRRYDLMVERFNMRVKKGVFCRQYLGQLVAMHFDAGTSAAQ